MESALEKIMICPTVNQTANYDTYLQVAEFSAEWSNPSCKRIAPRTQEWRTNWLIYAVAPDYACVPISAVFDDALLRVKINIDNAEAL